VVAYIECWVVVDEYDYALKNMFSGIDETAIQARDALRNQTQGLFRFRCFPNQTAASAYVFL
jgi:hypothetical protein